MTTFFTLRREGEGRENKERDGGREDGEGGAGEVWVEKVRGREDIWSKKGTCMINILAVLRPWLQVNLGCLGHQSFLGGQ